jgi:hypothetical protein
MTTHMCMFTMLCYAMLCYAYYTTSIGKSMLGYLLLYRWALEGHRIVVIARGHSSVLYCSTGAYSLDTAADVNDELHRDGVR